MILRTSLVKLKQDISELRVQLKNNERHDGVLKYTMKNIPEGEDAIKIAVSELVASKNVEKRYRYTSNVITLYGILEHFIESLVSEYVDCLNTFVPDATNLPSCIQDNYLPQCLDIAGKAERAGKLKGLKKLTIIDSLHTTLNDHKSSLLPETFVSIGGGNYKHLEICQCFIKLGAQNIDTKIKSEQTLAEHFTKEFGEEYSSNESSTLYQLLDELVDRRNDLAHGGNNFSLIKDEDFIPYIDLIEAYAESLCSYLRKILAEYHWNFVTAPVLELNHVYQNYTVAELVLTSQYFRKEGWLMYKTGGAHPVYGYCKIDNIRVNEIDYSEFEIKEIVTTIGLKLDCHINDSYSFKNLCRL